MKRIFKTRKKANVSNYIGIYKVLIVISSIAIFGIFAELINDNGELQDKGEFGYGLLTLLIFLTILLIVIVRRLNKRASPQRNKSKTRNDRTSVNLNAVDISHESDDIAPPSPNSFITLYSRDTAANALTLELNTLRGYQETGVTQYRILGALDLSTCPSCRVLDGRVYNVADAKPGINYPPFHDKCRCTTVAFFEGVDMSDCTRAARDIDGRSYSVPASMTAIEWYNDMVAKYGERVTNRVSESKYRDLVNEDILMREEIEILYSRLYNQNELKSPRMDVCIQMCKQAIDKAPIIARAIEEAEGRRPDYYPVFTRLAIIYEKRGEYIEALDVCVKAQTLGFTNDGTKGGMLGRMSRLLRKAGLGQTPEEYMMGKPSDVAG